MERKKSLFKKLLLRIHYRTSIAIIAIFLGLFAVSGFYFFGQNIVNDAEEQQRIARIQLNGSSDEDQVIDEITEESENIKPEEQEEVQSENIGGRNDGVTVTPSASPSPTSMVSPSATPSSTPVPNVSIPAENFVLGDPNAEIAVVAYYSFECVYCAKFINEVLPKLQSEYLDKGTIKLIFKNFPLNNHKAAPTAHNAAMCAANQGKFWQFHNELFIKQNEWAGKSESDVYKIMKNYATALSINGDDFSQCLDTKQFAAQVEKDKSEGKSKGITGTPTFIIGDNTIVGAQPFESFKAVIDSQ